MYSIETEEQLNGLWIAEIIELPGVVVAYGPSEREAIANVEALALRMMADEIYETKIAPAKISFQFVNVAN